MKKIALPIIFFFFLIPFSFSQAPEIAWENTIGGFNEDYGKVIRQTSDGNYIVAGISYSAISGDKTEASLGWDLWVLEINSTGEIIWQNTISAAADDGGWGMDMELTTDGGIIIGTTSNSLISGDKTETLIGGPMHGDFWIIKLDGSGNIEWQNTIGGYGEERLVSVDQTMDGGYLIGGSSNSSASFDKIENCIGGYDYWMLKLDASGNIVWQNTIGGGADEFLSNFNLTNDGGSILIGTSASNASGDKVENSIGSSDFWVVKLDEIGNIQWQNNIGGLLYDVGTDILETPDGGYILGGISPSGISGDKTEASIGISGYSDFWILKLNEIGEIQWQNTLGTEAQDALSRIHPTKDNGFLLAGYTTGGLSADKSEPNYGYADYWVLKMDSIGHIIWENTIGGWGTDYLIDIEENADSSIIMIGYSNSPASVDKSENYLGLYVLPDYWVVKLLRECEFHTFYADRDGDGFGNNDSTKSICDIVPPLGYVNDNTDCNDNLITGGTVYPGAVEICNLIDDNCNGLVDEGIPLLIYYLDEDADGFGNNLFSVMTCEEIAPVGYTPDNTDCNDSNYFIHEPILYFADADGDLFGDEFISGYLCEPTPPDGYAENNLDCNDDNILINPVTNEVCNSIDDNCNELTDEGLPLQSLYADEDFDNFGNALADTITCYLFLSGYTFDSTDCDDTNPEIFPGAEEIFNGLDDNCNKLIDEGITSITEHTNNSYISIYPNPNTGSFTIAANVTTQNFASPELSTIEIYNNLGQLIYSKSIKISSGTINETIQLQNPSPGIYLVNLKNQQNILNNKLIIE